MSQNSILLGFQDDSSMWIIIGVVLVLLFFVVAIVVIGLVIFFIMRKRKKAQAAAVSPDLQISSELAPGEPSAGYYEEAAAAIPEAAVAVDAPPPTFEPATPMEEIRADVAEAPQAGLPDLDFDPSRTVAITRENTVTISYGYIKFISGVLAGEQFVVEPEGSYIGRESSLAQIVVSDPRISKRHLWIGVKDGRVKIVDQDSRNGTFVNDPKSERITEAVLNSGDTVILGESDVARFEYQT
ncbi:MAG TPA: FHA domain-containing protein [Pyrinomonadaceae bacterium]|nr:FHA domain-containing protein [Pyrinomonadaceae bacterium]